MINITEKHHRQTSYTNITDKHHRQTSKPNISDKNFRQNQPNGKTNILV